MDNEVTRVARIAMPDGTPVWARISGAEELETPAGELSYTDTGFTDRVQARVESLHALIGSVARSLAEPVRAVRPDEVSVEFGIELTAKAGKVVGLLADGEGKAGITVTLTWKHEPPQPAPPTAGSPGTGVPDALTPVPPPRAAEPGRGAPGGAQDPAAGPPHATAPPEAGDRRSEARPGAAAHGGGEAAGTGGGS
jgi:hypothetical protein